MAKISGRDIVNLKNEVCELFAFNDWMDLGYITDCNDLIESHPRLLQSLDFHDNDYERNTLEVIKQIIQRSEANAADIIAHIEKIRSLQSVSKHSFETIPLLPILSVNSPRQNQEIISTPKENLMDVFISHSSQDSHAAKLLIDLIKTAFNMPAKKIRCTSVNGYRLPAGASTDEHLKKEVHESKVLIALLSPSSMNSTYVLFELGARWAISLPLVPLVTNGLGMQLLKGPLSGINALNLSDISQVHQLINDLGDFLGMPSESPAVYQEKADAVIGFLLKEMLPDFSDQDTESTSAVKGRANTVDASIKNYCEIQWPDDYVMLLHCIKEQKNASAEIKEPKPTDIPDLVFGSIIKKAIHEWPDDYTMQVHSRDEQINAYRELQKV